MNNKQLIKDTLLNSRYTIIRCLGQGGFGITYSAKDTRLEQDVVIKEYFPQQLVQERSGTRIVTGSLPDETSLYSKGKEQFLNEARTLATLFEIPGIVKVLDYFEENNTAYIVMEYVKGVSLLEWLERRSEPCSFKEACQMLVPIMDALEKVHKKGLLHRDISPDNIMVLEDGSVKLLDFGAAREFFLENDREKTMTILVKSGYAPPEQYESKGKHGPWTDVYALSSVVYEMITGTMPQNSQLRQTADGLYVPSAFGSDILPEEEDALILKGMALDPNKRYRSIKKMKADYLQEQGEEKTVSRKKVGLIAAIIVLVVAGIIAFACSENDTPIAEPAAGSYDRDSERYSEFLAYVEKNAVSKEQDPENEKNTIYTLNKESVLKWGERCNLMMIDTTSTQLIDHIKSKGYNIKHLKTTKNYTATIKPYGVIETDFTNTKHFKCDDFIELSITYDVLTDRICLLVIYIEPEVSIDINPLVTDVYMFLDKDAVGSRDEIITNFTEMQEQAIGYGEGFSGYEFNEMNYGYMSSDNYDHAKGNTMLVMRCIWGPSYYWPE